MKKNSLNQEQQLIPSTTTPTQGRLAVVTSSPPQSAFMPPRSRQQSLRLITLPQSPLAASRVGARRGKNSTETLPTDADGSCPQSPISRFQSRLTELMLPREDEFKRAMREAERNLLQETRKIKNTNFNRRQVDNEVWQNMRDLGAISRYHDDYFRIYSDEYKQQNKISTVR